MRTTKSLSEAIRSAQALELDEAETVLRRHKLIQGSVGVGEARAEAIAAALAKGGPTLTEPWRKDGGLAGAIAFLNWRFCGEADTVPAQGGIQPQSFGSPIGRWRQGSLTITINPAGCTLPPGAVVTAIMNVFGLYSAAQPFFSFRQVPSGGNIQVQFGGRNLSPSLAPGEALGTGGAPPSGRLNLLADVGGPLNPNGTPFTWTLPLLTTLVLHEAGHVLGLSHSTNPASAMYPFAPNIAGLDAETSQAIQGLYGWSPQRALNDRATTHRPSMTVTSSVTLTGRNDVTSYMAWKGSEGDGGIYWSESGDGINWTPQRQIPNVGTSHGPSLATYLKPGGTFDQGLMMAWKGSGSDNNIYWAASADLRNFGSQQRVPGVATSDRPALSAFDQEVVMAWKGSKNDTGIYWSRFQNNNWIAQEQIVGRGTSHAPALVQHDGVLHMFWKGVGGDGSVYHAVLVDPGNGIWGPQAQVFFVDGGNLSSGQTPIAIGTSDAPSAASRNGELLLAWKGIEGDSAVWFSRRNAQGQFSGQMVIPNVGTAMGPAVASLNGRIVAAWRGHGNDRTIYTANLG